MNPHQFKLWLSGFIQLSILNHKPFRLSSEQFEIVLKHLELVKDQMLEQANSKNSAMAVNEFTTVGECIYLTELAHPTSTAEAYHKLIRHLRINVAHKASESVENAKYYLQGYFEISQSTHCSVACAVHIEDIIHHLEQCVDYANNVGMMPPPFMKTQPPSFPCFAKPHFGFRSFNPAIGNQLKTFIQNNWNSHQEMKDGSHTESANDLLDLSDLVQELKESFTNITNSGQRWPSFTPVNWGKSISFC